MAELRFGVVRESVADGREWLDFARRAEGSGIGTLLLRDHFSAGAFGRQLAPFSGLAAAAAVTTRLRVGTIVLSNDFRHPAIVAHEEPACTCCLAAGSSSASGQAGTSRSTRRRVSRSTRPAGASRGWTNRSASSGTCWPERQSGTPRLRRDSSDSDDPRDRLPAAFAAKIGVLRDAAGDRFADLESARSAPSSSPAGGWPRPKT